MRLRIPFFHLICFTEQARRPVRRAAAFQGSLERNLGTDGPSGRIGKHVHQCPNLGRSPL